MKKSFTVIVIIFLLALVTTSLALADDMPPPRYGCPDRFTLDMHHHHMGGSGDMDHRHVGVPMDNLDMNGDGWICMKPVGAGDYNHVHIDNYFPFPP